MSPTLTRSDGGRSTQQTQRVSFSSVLWDAVSSDLDTSLYSLPFSFWVEAPLPCLQLSACCPPSSPPFPSALTPWVPVLCKSLKDIFNH